MLIFCAGSRTRDTSGSSARGGRSAGELSDIVAGHALRGQAVHYMFPWLTDSRKRAVMADQIVITEKSSQAKDVRAAVGSRYGEILPAEGHLFDLLEPEDVVPAWKRWSPILLRPEWPLRHSPGRGRQQSRQAQSHSRGTAHRQAGLARHRLRPRGATHRSGNSRALRVPRSGDAGAVHRAGLRRPSATHSVGQNQMPNMLAFTPPPLRAGRPTRSTTCHSLAPRPSFLGRVRAA